jgi:hypothetical protein
VATPIVARIDELFGIDAEARRQRISLEARDALRPKQSRPLLEGIRKQIEAARSTALPTGALAKACNYTHAVAATYPLPRISGTGVEQ